MSDKHTNPKGAWRSYTETGTNKTSAMNLAKCVQGSQCTG